MIGRPGFKACTPYGCMKMLEAIGCNPKGKHAVVIGRSNIVGKPMAMMLLQANATVTVCHSATPDLAHHTRQADIVVAAVGKRNVLTADMVKPGAVIIDVGMNRNDEGKLCGDVDFPGVREVAGWITPVPGGVGPMTRPCCWSTPSRRPNARPRPTPEAHEQPAARSTPCPPGTASAPNTSRPRSMRCSRRPTRRSSRR